MTAGNFLIWLTAIASGITSVFAQETLILRPVRESQVVYHSGYTSQSRNYSGVDAYTAMCQPGKVFGVNKSRTFFEFDLSLIPENADVVSAGLTLFGRGPSTKPDAAPASGFGNIGSNATILERVVAPWNEKTVTWDSQPATDPSVSVLLHPSTAIREDYHDIDVLPLIEEMRRYPTESFGFGMRLVTEEPTRGLFFCSLLEPDESRQPYLTVIFEQSASVKSVTGASIVASIAPNPFSEVTILNIHQEEPLYGNVVISDLQGRTLRMLKLNGQNYCVIDRSDLPAGLYIYKVMSGSDEVAHGKLTVE